MAVLKNFSRTGDDELHAYLFSSKYRLYLVLYLKYILIVFNSIFKYNEKFKYPKT